MSVWLVAIRFERWAGWSASTRQQSDASCLSNGQPLGESSERRQTRWLWRCGRPSRGGRRSGEGPRRRKWRLRLLLLLLRRVVLETLVHCKLVLQQRRRRWQQSKQKVRAGERGSSTQVAKGADCKVGRGRLGCGLDGGALSLLLLLLSVHALVGALVDE